ncbi:MAG: cofactor-independent phosphoglycerate mutase [Oscillospiraceae bacterium]|nr:cofactor-independent phosphoglycerate mutase [Oscillospiraceae bacterium]
MKYLVLLCDGMSDYPIEKLGGITPMQAAKKPAMDRLAAVSELGLVKTVQDHMKPGSDVANLSILGYDPELYYSGRSPYEAASMGIKLASSDVAIRCNLVKLSDADDFRDAVMLSYCADDIHTDEAAELIALVNTNLGSEQFKFYTGIQYRHCLIWKNGKLNLNIIPPHDITGRRVGDCIEVNENNAELLALMQKSYKLLKSKQANSIWLWGEGKSRDLPLFSDKYNKKAAMISAVDLLKGIGKFTGMDVISVPGATGYLDTNFTGKSNAAINALKSGADLVYLHIEAPDECGHRGEVEGKIKALELIDELVLAPFLEAFKDEKIKILICPDHATPLSLRTHTNDPVPYLIYDRSASGGNTPCGGSSPIKGAKTFTEETAKASGNFIKIGHTLMEKFLDE